MTLNKHGEWQQPACHVPVYCRVDEGMTSWHDQVCMPLQENWKHNVSRSLNRQLSTLTAQPCWGNVSASLQEQSTSTIHNNQWLICNDVQKRQRQSLSFRHNQQFLCMFETSTEMCGFKCRSVKLPIILRASPNRISFSFSWYTLLDHITVLRT